ncbi:MAG: diguanylate cyclase (GGDEF)-like protein/PAS domain S-box-containing protein [Gammaproteobacteria bacterium]|jgi:diguanylate cyclase (GGDEF)-like protein/PAS domain S-box-containing protein
MSKNKPDLFDLDTELSRRRNLERLKNATEQLSKIGHYEWDHGQDCLKSCSEEYASIFEMTVPEVMVAQNSWKNTLKQIHPEDVYCYEQETGTMRDSGAFDTSFRILLEGNRVKHIRELGIVTLDTGREDITTFGILQDVTEQVSQESDLKYKDEMAQQVESITDIGHFIYDEFKENYLYISEGYARIYGVSIEAYLSRMQSFEEDLSDVHSDDRKRVENAYRHYLNTAEVEECAVEFRIIRDDGQVRWLRELSKAKLVEAGRIRHTLGVVQDITAQVVHEQELLFKATIASEAESIADMGYFLFDEVNDKFIFTSPGLVKIVGMDFETFNAKIITNEDFINLAHEEDQDKVRQTYLKEMPIVDEWEVDYRLVMPDGGIRWVQEIGRPYRHAEQGNEQSIGFIRDITSQKLIEQELLYKDALANQAEAITDIGHFVYDELEDKYLFVSPGLCQILGVGQDELISSLRAKSWDLERVHEDDRKLVASVYDKFFIHHDTWQVEYRLVRADGEVRWVREMGKAHKMNLGVVEQTVGVLQDITQQKQTEQELRQSKDTLELKVLERTKELTSTVKQLQEQIEERKKVEAELDFLANHDALTGLPSLRLCKDRLQHSLAVARRNSLMTAVMFLDLDGFKAINDRLGHEIGDLVLIQIAGRIQQGIREIDTVARIGGDEFIIILSSLPEASIVNRIAANLILQIAQTVHVEGDAAIVSASIGIALYPENGETSGQLIRAADKAMYGVKKSGKSGYGFAMSELIESHPTD